MTSKANALSGQVALITGSAKRVGRAIALELADAGCDIAIHCQRSIDDARDLKSTIEANGQRATILQADLLDPKSWPALIDSCVSELGGLDILVNNASIFEPERLAEFDLDHWERNYRIHVTAPAALAHHAASHLARSQRGKIINIADIAALTPWPSHLPYSISKAGLASLTKALAVELAPDVQVNAVAPGIAIFPDHYDDATKDRITSKVPLKRAGTPTDIASTVRFLCTDAHYITGQFLPVDGGRSVSM